MRPNRIRWTAFVLAIAGLGAAVLALSTVSAEPPDFCPQPSGPPGIECQGCPTVEDPVVCTVRCAGGSQQRTFSNACFAACSGYMIVGECTRTGG
jgi:hypothetical protein